MKMITNMLSGVLTTINLLVSILLILAAYSSYLDPEHFPILTNLGLGFPIILLVQIGLTIVFKIFKLNAFKFSLIALLIVSPQIYKYSPVSFFKSDPPKEAFKVMSYNVMGFAGLEKDKNGKNTILTYLENSNADIICLQEYNESSNNKYLTRKDILAALKAYPHYKINEVGGKSSNNKLALFSKFPITSSNKVSYKSSYNGSVAYILKINDSKFLVINNHLESNKMTKTDKVAYEKILNLENSKDKLLADTKGLASKIVQASSLRQEQAKSVDNYIQSAKLENIIVCGDFNDSPLSYTNRLLESRLTNAFVQAGFGLGISYNQNKFYFRIDNILISKNLKAYHCEVDQSIKASDHYPIWCYIAKK